MEYGKRDWQRSDGKLKSSGRGNLEKGRRLSAYRPSDREKTEERKPNEMMRMESSYGGISLGASRKQKLTMVVHEKRASRGPGLKKDNREIEGNRTAAISELRGDFRTNSHSRRDSAFAFRESQEKRDAGAYAAWSRRRDSFQQEEIEKQEMRRQFFRELQFAREKSRYLMQSEGALQNLFEDLAEALAEDGTEDETEEASGDSEAQDEKKLQNNRE